MEAVRKDKCYTYVDYVKWDDDIRCELIDGVPYAMAAPTPAHQRISMELSRQFSVFFKNKPCEVFAAPIDVRLNAAGDSDDTVVQPDLIIVCDPSKIDDKGVNGAPDMVVEILSPTSINLDCIVKCQKYMKAGVSEYWIVDPDTKTVQASILKDGEYIIRAYDATDNDPVYALNHCPVNLDEVFE